MNLKDIINNQPTINIGMIGSVSNGKSSLTEQLTGTRTQRHSNEKKRNITIKLGYANAKIFQCLNCPEPSNYQSFPSDVMEINCNKCSNSMQLRKHISFVDCPGHYLLMATMLNGTCVMDSTILVESASNEEIPAVQTKEHLLAANIIKLKNDIVCMNKMDLVSKTIGLQKIEKFGEYLKGTIAEKSPIIPIIANHGLNKDIVCEYICKIIDEPVRDIESNVKMIIIRSFNVNHQNVKISELKGGVIGGTIMKGILKVGDEIEILPGLVQKNDDDSAEWKYDPIISRAETINSEDNNLQFAIPGGLIGVQLTIDPALACKDGLVGNIMRTISNEKSSNDKYQVYESLLINLELMNRKNDEVEIVLQENDILVINYNACNIKCKIVRIKKNKMALKLIDNPICAEIGDHITVSKCLSNNNIMLVGRGEIMDGHESKRVLNIEENYLDNIEKISL